MPIIDEQVGDDYLKNNNINTISLDTNVFFGTDKRVKLGTPQMAILEKLINNNVIEFVLSGTIKNEILTNLKKYVSLALPKVNSLIDLAIYVYGTKELKRDDHLNEIFNLLGLGVESEEVSKERLDDFLTEMKCEVIPDEEILDLAKITKDYFSGNPPFSDRKKKEFPDAFALNALEEKANIENKRILVVSNDGDWHDFCQNSERLYLVNTIGRAFDLIVNSPLSMKEFIRKCLNRENYREKLKNYLKDKMGELKYDIKYSTPIGWVDDIHKNDVKLDDVCWPDELVLHIIEYEQLSEGHSVTVGVPLTLKVIVTVDLNFYDYFDKETIDLGGVTLDLVKEVKVISTIDLVVDIIKKKFEIYELQLDSSPILINLGEIEPYSPEIDT